MWSCTEPALRWEIGGSKRRRGVAAWMIWDRHRPECTGTHREGTTGEQQHQSNQDGRVPGRRWHPAPLSNFFLPPVRVTCAVGRRCNPFDEVQAHYNHTYHGLTCNTMNPSPCTGFLSTVRRSQLGPGRLQRFRGGSPECACRSRSTNLPP